MSHSPQSYELPPALHGIGRQVIRALFFGVDFFRGSCSRGWACGIAWIMHRPPKPGTAGSNPAAPAKLSLETLSYPMDRP